MRRPGQNREIPPPLELECLKVLWRSGEANVKSVQEALAPRRPLAYTTVMTVLDRLARKGMVSRRKQGRLFLYASQLAPETVCEHAVKQLLENFFEGSADRLRSYLEGNGLPEKPQPEGDQTVEGAAAEEELDTALL
jgi:BlaI family transcriptional regulator, penicillinase repressor